jgi:predicted DNA-binding protein (MmcQ/YjbR family)
MQALHCATMLDSAAIRAHCLSKPGTSEDMPFGEETLVFRVGEKIFALLALDAVPTTVNLKCDPERAIELRERYGSVRPGYHMNKKHWNTVTLDGDVPDGEVRSMIDHSYELVARGLTRNVRAELGIE